MRQRKKDRPAERPVIPGHPRMSAGGSADPIGTGPNLRSAYRLILEIDSQRVSDLPRAAMKLRPVSDCLCSACIIALMAGSVDVEAAWVKKSPSVSPPPNAP